MTSLRQPFRAILAATDVAARLRLLPSVSKAVAAPVARRQLNKPPFWMTRHGDPTVRTRTEWIDARGGPIQLRLYLPAAVPPASPVIVYLHGGGFVYGGLDGCDYATRGLASRTGFPVVSVEYRLSPECAFPGPLEDCEDALRWVASARPEGIDPTRIAVAGDSAGGNLTAALALLVRDNDGPAIRHQTLVYPLTDGTISSADWDTYRGGGIDREAGGSMMRHYAPHHPADHPLVSPLHAPDLSKLPPALVITAEIDVLHTDGVRYAERLLEAGVPALHRDFDGHPHGFVTMPRLSRAADEALDLMAAEMTKALTASSAPAP